MAKKVVCGLACQPTPIIDSSKDKSKPVKLPSKKMKEIVETAVTDADPKKKQSRHKVLVSRTQLAPQSSDDNECKDDDENVEEIINTVLGDISADDKEKSAAAADDGDGDNGSDLEEKKATHADSGDDSSSESESSDGNGKGSGNKAAEADKYILKRKNTTEKSASEAESEEAEAQSEEGDGKEKPASEEEEAACSDKPNPEPVAAEPRRTEPPVSGDKEETGDKKSKKKKKNKNKKVPVSQEADADVEGTGKADMQKVIEKPVSEAGPSRRTRADHIVMPTEAKTDAKPKTNLKRNRAEKEAAAAAADDDEVDEVEPAAVKKKKKKKARVANNDDEVADPAVVTKKKKARVANDDDQEEPALAWKKKKARVANDNDGTNKIEVLSKKFDALFGAFKPSGDPLRDMVFYGANAGFCQLSQDQLAKMDDEWKAVYLELLPIYLRMMDLKVTHLRIAYEVLNRK